MGKRATGPKQHVKSPHSHKTKKRLEIKRQMLEKKADLRKRK